MNDDSTEKTRRTVLRQSALASGALGLGGVAFTGGAAADQPDIDRSVEVTFSNPCTGEDATDTDAREVFDMDTRTDASGGTHVNAKFFGKGRFVGEDSGLLYEGSIEGSINGYVSADGFPQTLTQGFQFKVISRGSAANFLAKARVQLTVNANGVTAVETEYFSLECL